MVVRRILKRAGYVPAAAHRAAVQQRDAARSDAAGANRRAVRQVAAYRRLLAAALEVTPEQLWAIEADVLTRERELTSLALVRLAAGRPARSACTSGSQR